MAQFLYFITLCLLSYILYYQLSVSSETEWWQTAVFYQIYPRSFKDTNGDGIGDLKGITEKLDYLNDTGIDAIWISPIFKSPMVDFGYDISDYYLPDPIFGTMEDFDELHAKVKRLGMKLVLDFVPNHTSNESDWFKLSLNKTDPYTTYYIWHDGKCERRICKPPNNWVNAFRGSAWTWREERKQFYLHQYSEAQPDLNYRDPNVVKEMKNILRFWLDKGIDGFRVDAVRKLFEDELLRDEPIIDFDDSYDSIDLNDPKSFHHIYTQHQSETYDMVKQWREIFDKYRKSSTDMRVMIVETSGTDEQVYGYYGTSNRPGAHFPFNGKLVKEIKKNSSAKKVLGAIKSYVNEMIDGRWPNWIIGSHDFHRVGTRVGEEFIDSMNILLLLLPGTAVTYYGEEIGMIDNEDITFEQTVDPKGRNAGPNRYKKLSRDAERTPFQWDDSIAAGFSTANNTWLPINKNCKEVNLKSQKEAITSHYYVYRNLTVLRCMDVIKKGNFSINVTKDNNVLAIRRQSHDNDVIAAINFSIHDLIINIHDIFKDVQSNMFACTSSISTKYEPGTVVDPSVLLLISRGGIVLSSFNTSIWKNH